MGRQRALILKVRSQLLCLEINYAIVFGILPSSSQLKFSASSELLRPVHSAVFEYAQIGHCEGAALRWDVLQLELSNGMSLTGNRRCRLRSPWTKLTAGQGAPE